MMWDILSAFGIETLEDLKRDAFKLILIAIVTGFLAYGIGFIAGEIGFNLGLWLQRLGIIG